MIQQNLLQRLQSVSPNTACILNINRFDTYSKFISSALNLRQAHSNICGGVVILNGLPSSELALAIVAFDGFVKNLVFIPDSIEQSTVNDVLANCPATDIFREGLAYESLANNRIASAEPYQTTWTLLTSGTTGTPKLVEHNLATLSYTIKKNPEYGKDFVWGLLYDGNRFAGLQVILQALFAGSALVIPQAGDFSTQISTICNHIVNALSATPTLWRKMLMNGKIQNLKLRQITLGGEIADQNIIDALKTNFPHSRITHIYASTEGGVGFVVNDFREGFPLSWLNKKNSNLDLSISSDNHLLVKPKLLAKGKILSARTNKDGYFDTEDLVRVDNERVYFIGRANGAINVGGNKVNPVTLENYLRQIEGVIDARVYGKANSLTGQLVGAEILSDSSCDKNILKKNIFSNCRRDLDAWQVPVFISFVESFKQNSSGKKLRIS